VRKIERLKSGQQPAYPRISPFLTGDPLAPTLSVGFERSTGSARGSVAPPRGWARARFAGRRAPIWAGGTCPLLPGLLCPRVSGFLALRYGRVTMRRRSGTT